MNPDSLQMMQHRSTAVRALRNGFESRGFIEVETPMLQAVHGGANARPFVTHINAYDTELFLRIAPELFLKRLSVGGLGKVFELNRNFRNEGADATHNPEFTSVEAYQPYADYHVMRELTRELLIETATAVFGKPIVQRPDGEIDISGEWPVITVHDAVSRATGVRSTPGHVGRATPGALRGARRTHDLRAVRRGAGPRAVRRTGRADHHAADLLHRLPARDVTADPDPPRPIHAWPSAGTWSPSAPRSVRRTPNWSTRSSNAAASPSSR